MHAIADLISGSGHYVHAYLAEIGSELETDFVSPNIVGNGTTCLEFYYQIEHGYLEILSSSTDIREGWW